VRLRFGIRGGVLWMRGLLGGVLVGLGIRCGFKLLVSHVNCESWEVGS